jgi:hypothetical protein
LLSQPAAVVGGECVVAEEIPFQEGNFRGRDCPTIALSYVQRVNDSLATRNGDWRSMLQNQSGITGALKDANDSNKDDSSAFSLANKDEPGSI